MIGRLFGRRRKAGPATNRVEPALDGQRAFKAAQAGARLAGGFNVLGATTPREEVRRELRGLVGHARHAAQNFDHARAYEMLIRRHVVGPNGIRLQMDVRDDNGRSDTAANDRIETAWRKWCRKGGPTICGRWSWWAVECQIATAIAREGGAFVRLHRGPKGGPNGLRIEPLPLDLLDLDLTQPLSDGGYIEAGIEFDEDGRPRAYHLWSVPMGVSHMGNRRRVRIPASDMVQVIVPEEIGQALGIPRSATALRLMNMGEGYREAAMEAAHFGAAAMGMFEREDASGQISGSQGEAPIDKIEAGSVLDLPPGVKYASHNPHYPEQAVGPFMRYMDTSVASGMGLSYATLTGDLSGANFSSLRAGKGEERDEWRMLQRAVYEALHGEIFRAWLEMSLLTQAVRLPMAKRDKFDAATWRPRGWPSVNPKDDATAAEADLRLHLKSRREIIAERGRDVGDVDAEIAEDQNHPDLQPPPPPTAPAAPPDPQEE